jgi:hypothetical protein
VLLIALKTGWARAEILALPHDEFTHILDKLTQTDE